MNQLFNSSLLMTVCRDKMVANFKTEESQRRLLTAVIAAHPELKLNFKGRYRFTPSTPAFHRYFHSGPTIVSDVVPSCGSSQSCSLPVRLMLTLSAIAQHFGPEDWGKDGIEHFFRPLKKEAMIVREMVKQGERAKSYFDNKVVS